MGKRGRNGHGTITAKGYRRVSDNGRRIMEHVMVWERHNGAVPQGHHIHHRNGNKLDNGISNLELVSPLIHKRLHSGCEWRDAEWWKPCRKCSTLYPVSHYYKRGPWVRSWCRPCVISNVISNKRLRVGFKNAREMPT